MKIVAVMPIKLNNERLPGKNTKLLGDKPLLRYSLETLKRTNVCDNIFCFCSDERVKNFLPEGVSFLKRDASLDLASANFNQIFDSFLNLVDADIYIYIHATAPFISDESILKCLDAVKSGEYDSAFCARRIQDFLWLNNKPLNFDASNLPRSQDLTPIYRETSSVYIFKKDAYLKTHRRICEKPYICEVSFRESIDVNEKEDFELAVKFLKE